MSKSTRTISDLMTEQAKQARREYARQWRLKNPDKVKASIARYWEKKSKAQAEETAAD
ncbi:MAG: hypothetical protein J5601_03755 [Elusimicrobiaceae bacterium]|nr:hypothetical protein [Elusimicrobiaceae bacterium]